MLPGETRKQYLARWQREYRKNNKPLITSRLEKKRALNPERHLSIQRRYYHRHKEKRCAAHRLWEKANSNKVRAYQSEYRKANKAKAKTYMADYRKNKRDVLLPKQRAYQNGKLANDPIYKLKKRMRTRLYCALINQGAIKSARSQELFGCTIPEMKVHLESQFTEGMSWENFGSFWHVDHVSPLAAFDLTKPHIQKLAFHYSNCRPLEAAKNLQKGDTVLQLHELCDI